MSRPPFTPLGACCWILAFVVLNGCWCHDPDVLVSLRSEEPEMSALSDPTGGPTGVTPGDGMGEVGDGGAVAGDCIDADGDGYGVGPGCLGLDCDDGDSGLAENGERRCYSSAAQTEGVGACTAGVQRCVEGVLSACEGEVIPSAETCDGVDNDCDGSVDETLVRRCYSGPDGTQGIGLCSSGMQTCVEGAFGACEGEVLPSAETCDALDNDCDGTVDEALVRTCYSGPAGTAGVGVCAAGTQTCSAGTYGACEGEALPSDETCDSLDNDCDGIVDEALVRTCYSGPAGTAGVGVCSAGTQTCSAGVFSTCEGETLPSAETCDAIDNDCDGSVDEALVQSCYAGPAGTEGVGLCSAGNQSCAEGAWGSCGGYTLPQPETCDEADNNCDGNVDENLTRVRRSGADQDTDPVFRPVDIIVVIDNSGSMTDEIVAVENNLNNNFASILDASGLDYRVILLAKHGRAATDQSICVRSPLSGNGNCTTVSTCPVNGPRFFHYSVEIGSHDSFARILDTYDAPDGCGLAPKGWSGWLRPGAARVFIEITDDGPTTGKTKSPNAMTAEQFEAALFALTPASFGSATQRDYTFHSIVGQKENSPRLAAWPSTAPIVTELCTGNGGNVKQAGVDFQKLSIWTGGLRFPVCEFQSFDAIFQDVATGILIGSQLSCVMNVSQVPDGSGLDETTLELIPTNGGQTLVLQRVADAASCTSNGFYVEGTALHLCPDSCSVWRADPTAYIDLVFACRTRTRR